ncbi:sialidase family protein [Flavitalea sp.]|nr:sialidase family protein [Flavitalea sp.]
MNRLFITTFCIATIFIALILSACGGDKKSVKPFASNEMLADTLPGQCPYLTKDNKGNTVLSWVRMINDSSAVFCYAVSPDGKTFGSPIVIPGSEDIEPHGENLPKIIFKESGEVIALWGTKSTSTKNKFAGMVSYTQSFDGGNTWNAEIKSLVPDTSANDQRYYDVALLPNGEVGVIWLDNRKTNGKEGSALFFATTKGKKGFVGERRIAESCCQCCRTDLFVDSKGGIHTLYRGVINDSIRDMVHAVSVDGGKTFSEPKRISDDNWVINGCPHTGPSMTENKEGLQFAWFTGGKNKGSYYASSKDNGISYSPRNPVSELGSHPQLTSFKSGRLAIVWDEMVDIGNKSIKKIGIQTRAADGKNMAAKFITTDTLSASFPVITTINETSALVAYSQMKGRHNYITYQLVSNQ